MRRFAVLLFLLTLLSPVQADLNRLLELQKIGDSGAYVSSVFDDWRTVSKYRSKAGLHYGFDIAMWAGSEVRAAWSGKVVAITHWYGREYGVTVRSSSGHETTYGHIKPLVAVGDNVSSSTVLGTVVVDHVDVKMRAPDGRYVDFASMPIYDKPDATFSAVPAKDLSGAKAAHQRYLLVLADFEKEQFRYSQGWGAKVKLEQLRAELKKLEPLARVFEPKGLPQPTVAKVVKQVPSVGRPLTDQYILGSFPRVESFSDFSHSENSEG